MPSLALVLALLLLAAAPAASPSAAPEPAASTAAATPAETRALSLDEAIRIAGTRNPQVRAAEAETARARTVDHQALSFFYPQIQARATMQWNDRRQTVDFVNPLTSPPQEISFALQPWWLLNWEVSATQNLSLYGPAIPLLKQARAATRAAGALRDQTRDDVAFAAARAYYAALEADALAGVAADAKASADELLRQTNGKRSAGRATEAEVLRAKVRVSEAEQAASQARRGAEEAHAALADVLGDSGPFILARPPRPTVPEAPAGGDAASEALARRPDLAAAREGISGAADAKDAALRQFLPTLSLTALYTGYETSEQAQLFGQTPTRYSLLGVATVPIFDGTLKYWQLREKREALREAQARADAARVAAAADIRRARSRLAAAREAESLSHERLALATRAAELVSGQYQLGAATQLEVLDADASRSAAQRDASAAELETDVAVLDLRRALGLPIASAETTEPAP